MPTWEEDFEAGPAGAEITTANTGLTTVFYGGTSGITSAPPVFSTTPAGTGMCAVSPPPPPDSPNGNRHGEYTYETAQSGYASCRVSLWMAAPRSTAYSSGYLMSMLGHFDDLGFTAGVFSFFHKPAAGPDLANIEFLVAGAASEIDVLIGPHDEGWHEFGGDYTTATETWTAYLKDPAGVTIWSDSGTTTTAAGVIRPVGLDALSRSDKHGIFSAVDSMEYVTPSVSPLRKYPRHDGRGMSPVRRGYPPVPAPRLIGGQP